MAGAAVQKWGNSLAVRIPKRLAQDAGLSAGTEVELTAEGGRIVIRPAKPRYSLEELVAGITRQNTHGETDTGRPAGREAW